MFIKKVKLLMTLCMGITSTLGLYGTPILQQSIFEWIQNPGSFSILTQMLGETQMDSQVNKLLDSRTIFAPNDQAFKQFGRVGLLDGQANTDNKKKFVTFFIIPKVIKPDEVTKPGATFATIAGAPISTDQIGKILYYMKVKNGIIYVVDTVPVHPELKKLLYPDKK